MVTITTWEEEGDTVTMREWGLDAGELLREWQFSRSLAQRMKDQFPDAVEHAQVADQLQALQAGPRKSALVQAMSRAMERAKDALNPFWRWW